MTATLDAPPQLTGMARRAWQRLAAPTSHPQAFDPAAIGHLPEPVRRWLTHAIEPGTPLRRSATLIMHGDIRLVRWRRFEARQILTPGEGFIWAATAHLAGLPVIGFDRYSGGTGQMRWRLLGALPIASATGPDITRSAAGRLASELVMVPAAALSSALTWESAGEDRATAHVTIGGDLHAVTITVATTGALEAVAIPRWGDPDKGGFREHLFGAEVHREAVFDGYTIPAAVSAGWWYGTERWPKGEFIRFTIDEAVYH
jgi:hypothetical protein